MGRRKKHEEHEEHVNHERWLVTYADMVTLLMVLFIVMFAMSAVDEKKFNALKSGLAAGFGQSTSLLSGSSSIQQNAGLSAMAPVAPASKYQQVDEVTKELIKKAVQQSDAMKNQANYEQASKEVDRLSGVQARVLASLKAHGLQDDVTTTIDESGLSIHLVSKHVTFAANMATLSPRGEQIIDILAPVLKDLPDPIEIEGHTNQVNVKPMYYATDWDLSAARAITVLRRLNEVAGIPSTRLHASAYGHEKPLIDPNEPGSQEINKRVDIIIVSSLPPESQALLGQVVKDRARSAEGVTTP